MMDHFKAIKSGVVTGCNIRGIKKAINATTRRRAGWSVSSTTTTLSPDAVDHLEEAIEAVGPRIGGELHDSGLKMLRWARNRRRLSAHADIVENLEAFYLVRFDRIGRNDENCVAVYQATGAGKSFLFRYVPWQSGGDGLEVLT